ncbi:MAG: aldo/keto reductase [Gammaproteobacteria bacterium]|nr:aldo/keto reductase [Gammaproteobacteria bacterium]
MEYITLANTPLRVSRICLGTMTFGQQNDEAQSHEQLDYAVGQGINFIDTAEMYPVPPRAETVHQTERFVGNWLVKQKRDELVIATKVTGSGRAMNWIRGGQLEYTRENIHSAIEGSLERLKTDYIDLYQLHWPERNTPMFGKYLYDLNEERAFTPILETLQYLEELVEEGTVRHIGLSNEWPWGVMQFLNAAEQQGLPRIASVQNAYNLINRTYETALLEMCHREKVALLPYSPLAFGHLSAKYIDNPEAVGRITLFNAFGQRYEKPNVIPAVKAYADLARRHGLTPVQLALSFVYSRWFVASTIIGATTMEQLQENIDAMDIQWTPELESEVSEIQLRYFNPAP